MQKKFNVRKRLKLLNKQKLPRLIVFRSLKNITAQVVDVNGKVLAEANSLKLTNMSKSAQSEEVGKKIASKCLKAKINRVIFDRGTYNYSGKIKLLADSARQQGLKI